MIKGILLALGLIMEGSVLSDVMHDGGGEQAFPASLARHLAASMMVAACMWYWLPAKARPGLQGLPLLFNITFFIPLLGPAGVLAALLISRFRRRIAAGEPYASLALPEFVLSLREPEGNFNQTGIRSRLAHTSIPPAQRLRSMLALQGMPPRISNPLLQGMLGDATDDIRLVAYGLLDTREKKINDQIHQQSAYLKTAEARDLRLICLRELAELNWELVYSGLAQGDLRAHALGQALSFAEDALKLAPGETGLWFLKGRILHAMGKNDEAYRILDSAMTAGFASSRVLPYMAEIAFDRGDYAAVRTLLAQIPLTEIAPLVEGAAGFWVPGGNPKGAPRAKEKA